MSIEKFSGLDIHDSSVEDIQFSFSTKSLKIIFGVYNDEISKYEYLEVQFKNVSSISFGGFEIDDVSSIEIYSWAVNEIGNNSFKGKFIFLLGLKKPSVELIFSFSDIATRNRNNFVSN